MCMLDLHEGAGVDLDLAFRCQPSESLREQIRYLEWQDHSFRWKFAEVHTSQAMQFFCRSATCSSWASVCMDHNVDIDTPE